MTTTPDDITNTVTQAVDHGFDSVSLNVMDAIENGTAFDRTLETTVSGLSDKLGTINAAISDVGSVVNAVNPALVAKVTGIANTLSSITDKVGQFGSHVTDMFDTIPDRLSTFSSHQGLKNALEKKAQSCDSMKDFFGSITDVGKGLVSGMDGHTEGLLQSVNDFKALTVELQTVVADTKSSLSNAINAEISLIPASDRKTQLQNALTAIENQFSSGDHSAREGLVENVKNLFTGAAKEQINGLAIPMFNKDFDVISSANKAESHSTGLGENATKLKDMIDGENGKMQQAEQKLLKFAQASSISSMFKGDPCVNTLMGHIGTDNLLKKLGGIF